MTPVLLTAEAQHAPILSGKETTHKVEEARTASLGLQFFLAEMMKELCKVQSLLRA